MVHRDGDAPPFTDEDARARRGGGLMDDVAPALEVAHDEPPAKRPAATALQWSVILAVMAYLAWAIWRVPEDSVGPAVLFFIFAAIVVDLIPVPAWGGMQLSLSFPILLGVALVFPPPIAGMVAFLGSADPRELRREISLRKALWNRAQMALSIVLGSAVFNAVSDARAEWGGLILGATAATVVAYALNTIAVATTASLERRMPLRRVIVKMHGTAPIEFLLSYLGLGLFGIAIARFYLVEGVWSVAVFLAPLVFARQMYFRSRALAEQLAERNDLLAEQAARLEHLLEKEHATVDELRELNRMKGEFVAVVSHELRTPVTALIGYAKTLRQPEFADDPTMRREFLERMERQGDRLLRLVENLLTTSKLESDVLKVAVGRVLFEDLVREVVEGLATEADRVFLDVPADLPVLHTDRQLLGRVVTNVLDNALKYSPDASPVELGASATPNELTFWVRDHGIGITPEQERRIFERFYQADSSTTRRFRGAGLGLSMVRDLLGHLGGSIEVQSEAGAGSTFTIRLPVKAEVGQPG
jgi:signal transduction histidine kinase